jgi:hypothetical protein
LKVQSLALLAPLSFGSKGVAKAGVFVEKELIVYLE